ncbi:hypothetical protein CC80DRAFT_11068 [Byssothecium circinans]|uniref:Uncharacterized protein n=1 Tax=Byssothecium circinans TaxID=147558 RepID=A0A6A5UFU3_9PLEO|nr:hypothetical protein CC80DRAFT_11068 [Byssothecium circinans]
MVKAQAAIIVVALASPRVDTVAGIKVGLTASFGVVRGASGPGTAQGLAPALQVVNPPLIYIYLYYYPTIAAPSTNLNHPITASFDALIPATACLFYHIPLHPSSYTIVRIPYSRFEKRR